MCCWTVRRHHGEGFGSRIVASPSSLPSDDGFSSFSCFVGSSFSSIVSTFSCATSFPFISGSGCDTCELGVVGPLFLKLLNCSLEAPGRRNFTPKKLGFGETGSGEACISSFLNSEDMVGSSSVSLIDGGESTGNVGRFGLVVELGVTALLLGRRLRSSRGEFPRELGGNPFWELVWLEPRE
jgi:hypothetical protein